MCSIYHCIVCTCKQSRSGQLPFCVSPIFHFEILGNFHLLVSSIFMLSKLRTCCYGISTVECVAALLHF